MKSLKNKENNLNKQSNQRIKTKKKKLKSLSQ